MINEWWLDKGFGLSIGKTMVLKTGLRTDHHLLQLAYTKMGALGMEKNFYITGIILFCYLQLITFYTRDKDFT